MTGGWTLQSFTLPRRWPARRTFIPLFLLPGAYRLGDERIYAEDHHIAHRGRLYTRVRRGRLGTTPVDHPAGIVAVPDFGRWRGITFPG